MRGGAPPRIVHLLATLDPGGVERSVLTLCRHLDPARYRNEVWYLTGRGSLAPVFTAAGIPVRKVPLLARWDLSVVPRLTFALRQNGTALLHTHHPEASAFGRLAAPRAGLRAVVTTEHSVTHWSEPGAFVNRLIRTTAATADRVVSVSKAVEYLSKGAGAALPDRSVIIPDGAPMPDAAGGAGAAGAAGPHAAGAGSEDSSASDSPGDRRRAARERHGLQAEGPVIGSVGRLSPAKGFDTLIEMMPLILSERADAQCVLAGDGPERARLERKARDLDVADRVVLTGAIDDPYRLYPALDVCVVPSRTEGGGLCVLEAMAHGVPVVAAQAGGLPDHLETGEGGLMTAPNAPRDMAAVVLYFLNSALYSADVGGAGRRKIASGGPGSAPHMAGEYARLYDELLTRL